MGRSVKASQEGQKKSAEAFNLIGKTKEYIAGASDCSRPTLDKFFDGRKISILRSIF